MASLNNTTLGTSDHSPSSRFLVCVCRSRLRWAFTPSYPSVDHLRTNRPDWYRYLQDYEGEDKETGMEPVIKVLSTRTRSPTTARSRPSKIRESHSFSVIKGKSANRGRARYWRARAI